MSLTDRDVSNTERLRKILGARSNAHAVSIALSLTAFLADRLGAGEELVLRTSRGELERVIMTELEPLMLAGAAKFAATF